MFVNGVFEYNLINLTKSNNDLNDFSVDFMNIMTMKLNDSSSWINNTIFAYYTKLLDIKTSSLFSGEIYTNDSCNNFSLECSNTDSTDNTCKNLTLYTAPMSIENEHGTSNLTFPTYLECNGYGCQYINFYSLNGLNDIHFEASPCLCTVDCIGNCMGDWNVYCSNVSNLNSSDINFDVHSLFGNDECSPDYCCGDIVNQSEPYFVCPVNLYEN